MANLRTILESTDRVKMTVRWCYIVGMGILDRRRFLGALLQVPLLAWIASKLPISYLNVAQEDKLDGRRFLPKKIWRALVLSDPDICFLDEKDYSQDDLSFWGCCRLGRAPWVCTGDFDDDGRLDTGVLCRLRGHIKLLVAFEREDGILVQEADDLGRIPLDTSVAYLITPTPSLEIADAEACLTGNGIHIARFETCGHTLYLERSSLGKRWVEWTEAAA